MTWTVKSKHGLFGCVTTLAIKLTLHLLSSPFPLPNPALTGLSEQNNIFARASRIFVHFLAAPAQLPLVASKLGHEIKNTCLIGCQTWHVLPPNIWSLTAVKANCRAKGKLFICFWSASSPQISFFSTFRHISRSETAHLPPEIILNV